MDSTEGTESGDGVHSCASTRCSSVPAHCFPSVKCSGSECCKPCAPNKVAGITPPLGGKTLLANDNHDQCCKPCIPERKTAHSPCHLSGPTCCGTDGSSTSGNEGCTTCQPCVPNKVDGISATLSAVSDELSGGKTPFAAPHVLNDLTSLSGDGVDGSVQYVPGGKETQPISPFEVDFESDECRQHVADLCADLGNVLGRVVSNEVAVSLLNTVRDEYSPEGKIESPDLEKDVYPFLRAAIKKGLSL